MYSATRTRVPGPGTKTPWGITLGVFRLFTEICSGNLPGSGVPVNLGRGQPPKDGESDREEKAVATDASLTRMLKVGGVVGLALVLMAGVGLGFLWRPGRPGS